MRYFGLINSKGKRYNLTDMDNHGTLLYDPEGLGFEYDTNFEVVGNQQLLLERIIKQPMPSGTIKFNGYADYAKFIEFIQHTPLELVYKPDKTECRLRCTVKELEKTELGQGHWLHCKVKFEGIGQWYRYVAWENDPFARGKTYKYDYPYAYTNNTTGVMAYESLSNLEGPIKITMLGPVRNPWWTHTVNGVLVATGKVFCTIPEGHRLIVSSVLPYVIGEYDSSLHLVENRYKDSDFSTERFLNLRLGNNKIAFFADDATPLNVAVEAYDYYESV